MKKFLTSILALSILVSCLTVVPTMAQTTDPNAFLYVPMAKGAEAAALLVNSTSDSGADAEILYDEENDEVTIEFPEGKESGETIERKRTEVNLDLSSVKNYRQKYVSFDITLETLMDLVITPEPYNVNYSGDIGDKRPFSLYFTDNMGTDEAPTGYMAPTQHARKQKYETTSSATGYKNNITGSWWIDEGITQQYETYKPINVKFIITSTMGVNGENDEVQVYINGVRKGQDKVVQNVLDSWLNNYFHFAHYSTKDFTESIYLSNLEMGYCERKGMDAINVLDPNEADKTWEFPEGNNTFISITLPTTADNAYYVKTPSSSLSLEWFKNMGVVNNWGSGQFKTDGSCNYSYNDILSWKNVHTWKDSSEVTVTFEVNKTLGTFEVYDNLGHWIRNYTTAPTSVSIIDKVGSVVPTKVVSGTFAALGSSVREDNTKVTSFDANTGKLVMSEFGVTGKNKDLMAIYAWYNANGVLINANLMDLKSDATGVYTLSYAKEFGSVAPAGATTLKTFLWDKATLAPIRTANVLNGSLIDVTSTRILGRTEYANGGYSLNWPGSGIEFTFEGSNAQLYCVKEIDPDKYANAYFTPYIDGVAQDRIIINQGWNTIASGLDSGEHTVKLVRSSEPRNGRVWVSLIKANNVAPTENKSRMIEFFGDSYSAAYGNMGVISGSSVTWGDAENTDVQKAFPTLIADNFNADSIIIAYSNKGVYKNGSNHNGLTIPELAKYSDIVVDGDTTTPSLWDYSKRDSDLVVMFLGTNDGGYRNSKVADEDKDAFDAEFKTAYVNFIKDIRAKYSDAKILCVSTPNGTMRNMIESVVGTVNDEGDNNVNFYALTNWSASSIYGHPSINEHKTIADELTAHISTLMGWEY